MNTYLCSPSLPPSGALPYASIVTRVLTGTSCQISYLLAQIQNFDLEVWFSLWSPCPSAHLQERPSQAIVKGDRGSQTKRTNPEEPEGIKQFEQDECSMVKEQQEEEVLVS